MVSIFISPLQLIGSAFKVAYLSGAVNAQFASGVDSFKTSMIVKGAPQLPNNWSSTGANAPDGQSAWFEDMFAAALKRPWVGGFAFWDWAAIPYTPDTPGHTYNLCGTRAAEIVRQVYQQRR